MSMAAAILRRVSRILDHNTRWLKKSQLSTNQRVISTVVKDYQNAKEIALQKPLPDDIDPHTIFTNNELALSEIQVYGFDYDYTLAAYNNALERLIFDLGKQALLHTKNYPKALTGEDFKYDPNFAIRGLHFDLKKGLLLKLDAFHRIQKDTVYRGTTKLPWDEVLELYSGFHVPVSQMNKFHGSGTEMHQYVDAFALPEVYLVAQVIQYFMRSRITYDPEYVFWDVRNAVQSIHSSGQLHNEIINNIDKYLPSGPELTAVLNRLVESNKTLFLISNSSFPFINAGMTHMFGKDWRDMFDVVIINARKPSFFTSQKRPFRAYSVESGTNMWHRVTTLDKGYVYSEGNLLDLQRHTQWAGSSVLYFGDHVYTDLADATLQYGWRTGAILPELHKEIDMLNSVALKRKVMTALAIQGFIEKHQNDVQKDILDSWLIELQSIKKQTKDMFNTQFGSPFRTYHSSTYFSRRLQRFADVYTASLTNLLHYDIEHTFYPRRGALAHEKLYGE